VGAESKGELERDYDRLAEDRTEFLFEARDNAYQTIDPGLFAADAGLCNTRRENASTLGAELVMDASSTAVALEFPHQVHWMQIDVEFNDDDRQKSTDEQIDLDRATARAMRLSDHLALPSYYETAYQLAFVASSALLHFCDEETQQAGRGRARTKRVVKPKRLRLIPLSQFVIDRVDQSVRRIISRQFSDENDPDQPPVQGAVPVREEIITEVDYWGGRIRQQVAGKDDVRVITTGDNPARWVLIEHGMPVVGRNYPRAYVSLFFNLIWKLEQLARSERDIIGEMATLIRLVQPNSGLNYQEVAKWAGPICVEGMQGSIHYVEKPALAYDLQGVAAAIARDEQGIRQHFLTGLLSRPDQEARKTATEVLKLVEQMDATSARIYGYHTSHGQRDGARALVDLAGYKFTTADGDKIDTVVLTGISALKKIQSAEHLVQIISVLAQWRPDFVQSLPVTKLFKRLSSNANIETDDLIGEGMEAKDLVQQLLVLAQRNPEEVMQAVGEFIQTMTGNTGDGDATGAPGQPVQQQQPQQQQPTA